MDDDTQVIDASVSPGEAEAAPEEQGPISLDDAFQRAAESAEAPEREEEGGEEPPEAAPADAQGQQRPAPIDTEREWQQRLAAAQRAAVSEYVETNQLMEGLREEYLQLLALRSEDPEQFNHLMWDAQDSALRREFFDGFARSYPTVSLDAPQGKTSPPTPAAVQQNVYTEVFTDLNTACTAMATESGLPAMRVDELRAAAQGPWGFLSSVFTEAVKASAEKQREAIRAEERKAAQQEATAHWSQQKVVTPRVLGVPAGSGTRRAGPPTWEDAIREAAALIG